MSVYTKQTWTDNVTPVDKAHMDVIENGVFASQFRDEKGVANGYASLDASAKVPVAQLPISYGTSLPGSPVDGQEAILVDSLTAPTYQWRFRYNAGSSSAYKWEFVGGPPLYAFNATASAITPAWPTTGALPPVVAIPRAGIYQVTYAHVVYIASATVANLWLTVIGPGVASGVPPVTVTCDVTNYFRQQFLVRQVTFTGSGAVQGAFGNQGNNVTSQDRAITAVPVCVS